jgi:hypothetical protein
MLRHLFLWVPIGLCAAVTGSVDSSPVQEDRVAIARQRVTPILIQRFAAVGLPYPVSSIFFRVHKMEREFELWARNDNDGSYRLVQIYPIFSASGRPGPKRREGDRQVPIKSTGSIRKASFISLCESITQMQPIRRNLIRPLQVQTFMFTAVSDRLGVWPWAMMQSKKSMS